MFNNILKIFTLVVLFLYQVPALAVSKTYITKAIEEAAHKARVPKDLLLAICTIESNLKDDAYVFDDGGNNNHAYGICQVLGTTAAKYVGFDSKCNQDFRDMKKNHRTCKLFGPRVNALAAALYLRDQIKRYNGDLLMASAAYNSGSVRKCSKKGWVTNKHGDRIQPCRPGGLLNSYYVKRLKKVLSRNSSIVADEFSNIDTILVAERS